MALSSISGSAPSSIYQMIDQYMQIEQRPRDELVSKKKALYDKKSVFSEMDSILSALKTKADYLSDTIFNPFLAKSGTSSNPDVLGITVKSSAVTGNHEITVDRLAKADTRVSDQYNDSDSSFSSFSTDQTFTIEVGHPTDTDANNRVQISVTVGADAFSGTNDTVLQAIADAVNTAMSQAVGDETINSDEVIHASVVNEERGTSRLVFRSENTGYTYRMDFGSSPLLDALNINNNALSSGTTGGYVTPIGSSATDSELNAQFTMDGLAFYRDSNTVSDAIDGITLKLLNTFSTTETVTVTTDTDTIKEDIQDFIDKYNDAIDFIRKNTRMDPDTHKEAPIAHDYTYRAITTDLRSIAGSEVSGTTNPDYNLLYDIGIEADQEGKLSISDSTKLIDALEANPEFVSDLFTGENGIATKIKEYIDNFVKAGGTIDQSKKLIDNQVTRLDDRIKDMNELLDKKEKQYFDQFSKLQQTMAMLQNQQAIFSSFMSGGQGTS